jgi:mono/diheme cytochrome c family protein
MTPIQEKPRGHPRVHSAELVDWERYGSDPRPRHFTMRASLLFGLSLVLVSAIAFAAPPAAQWNFGSEETSRLQPFGGVHRDVPGPRPPEFPDFEVSNTAVKFDGKGARYVFEDAGAASPFDFTNGDSITIEAWVKVDELHEGENRYIIGKGRTGASGFERDNQNWALRLRETDGKACLSFLFATPVASGAKRTDSHWHRWTTAGGFEPSTGWHHVAVAYKFGEPESVRGWIDGRSYKGGWDMGGATKDAPVVDDDAIWIGSSMGGSAANSFRGLLDSIAVHREVLTEDVIRGRFRREGGPIVSIPAPVVMPELGELPAGRVQFTSHEGLPAHNRWLNEGEQVPPPSATWSGSEFLISRLPRRYDSWGIRDSWKAPVLMRAAADVTLPPGEQKILYRSRGLSRLWINGQQIAGTLALTGSTDGHQPVKPLAALPAPGARRAGYEMQEAFGLCKVPADGRCRVVFETVVGGKNFRAEPGETLIALFSSDGQTLSILQPAGAAAIPTPLRDKDVELALHRVETSLQAHDDGTRQTLAASQDDFWNKRHEFARTYIREGAAAGKRNWIQAGHPVDALVADKIKQALAASGGSSLEEAKQFHGKILPILSTHCFRCHGEKENGGLRLDSRAAALRGGDSENPAIVAGKPEGSPLLARIRSTDEGERMPPSGDGLKPDEIAALEGWIKSGAPWPAPPVTPEQVASPGLVDDAAFLRRAYLDIVGVPPTESEAREFLESTAPQKRTQLVDRLLADDRWADHWVSYWQEVLAENPNMLKPSLNNTGPFRWFLYEALRDNRPFDRLVTELILLRGSEREGGSAGFGLAADNDAPFAAKGHVIGTAFLGIELQCARCHDSPFHSTKQRDLYALAAMFERKPITVPVSSTVPAGFFEKKDRESLIHVTLKPKEPITPTWPFAETTGCTDDASLDALIQNPKDSRERLAALVTAPQNKRFSQVLVNRVWRRLIGAGFVEPAHDWEGHAASHPELLDWLARDFVANGYDLKHLVRTIMTSDLYQREAIGANRTASPELRFFNAPERRRLSAEQVLDSLFAASGTPLDVEEITFDPDGRRPANTMISLGVPTRAWEFASLSNERDRPSLSLPRAQAVADVLEAFGWTGSRQSPRTDRETDPNVLQPGVLANSVVSTWVTRASLGSELADLAVDAKSPEALVDSVFLRFLSRTPTSDERTEFVEALSPGFKERVIPADQRVIPEPTPPLSRVTWSNHLVSEANSIQLEMERRARTGAPPDPRLRPQWRETYEDFVWSLINTREFVWVP